MIFKWNDFLIRIDVDKNCFLAPSLKFFKEIFVSMNLYSKDGTDSQFF